PFDLKVYLLEAASGQPRLLTSARAPSEPRLLGAARHGIFTQQSDRDATTLRHIDTTGHVVWTRTLTGAQLSVMDVVATPTGGGIFMGEAVAPPVDLGDIQVDGEPGKPLSFVFELD